MGMPRRVPLFRAPIGTYNDFQVPIQIPSGLSDDNDFIRLVNKVVAGVIRRRKPTEVWIIHIDNWFDHKWLRFPGYAATASPVPLWQSKLTFPPFTPNRVLGQCSYERSGDEYVESPLPKLPHRDGRWISRSNPYRRVEDFGEAALFVWYSGNSLKNGRGSMMVYWAGSEDPICWFASFSGGPQWTVERTKSISREEVLSLLAES